LPIWSALLDADPDLPQRRQIRAVELALEEHASEHAESRPVLGAALGLDWPDNAFTATLLPKDRKALLEAVLLQVLGSAAREAALDGMALMLVLEDLHAADPLSADLLLVVARAVQDLPVLVVLTYRPVDGGPAQDVLAHLVTLPCFEQIEPGGMDAQQSEQLIRAKLASLYPERMESVPATLIDRITGRAQGNPFFVEELLNYLHDRGIDPRDTAAMQALDLPASLHGLVLSRIDQLQLQLQLTLKVASIIGRVFRVSDLSDYHPMLGAPDRVRQQVNELGRLGFTPPDPADPELTHLFKHLVTQEVAYESIAFSTREQLHSLYAEFLEARYADRLGALAPQLAHHYACAARHDKACIYLRKAGEQAAARYANEEALDCFARALKWLPQHAAADRYAVVLQREAVLALLGQHADRRADLAEADRMADKLADPVDAHAEVAVRRARLEMDTGDFSGAQVWAQVAITALERGEEGTRRLPLRMVDALHQEARAIFFMGKAADARPQLQRALALARDSGYARGEYNILSMLGLLHWHAGDYAAADELLNQAVRLIDQVGDPRRQLDILNNLGVVAKTRGRHAQALAHYGAAQAIARRIGDRSGVAMLLNNRGALLLELGDYFQAGVFIDQAARMFGEVQEPVSRGQALLNRAEAHRGLGQYGTAALLAEQALTLLRAGQSRLGEAILLDNLGLVALAQCKPEEARSLATQALALVREVESHGLQSGILCHLGRACTAAGAWSDAAAALDEADRLAADVTEGVAWLELRGAQVDLALVSGRGLEARHASNLADILAVLLDDSAELAQWLALWVHEVAHRALLTLGDARAGQLLSRSRHELQRRCDRIPDAAARRDFMAVTEHQALLRAAAPTG
jgi:tetratricopeptide (TPR) repeat protein